MKKRYLLLMIFIILISVITFLLISEKSNSEQKTNTKQDKPLYLYNNFSTFDIDTDFSIEDNFIWLNNMYYKVVNSYKEYTEYKNIWNKILSASEEDFKNNFMIIVITENDSMRNTSLEELYTDDDTLYVGMNKKDIPDNQNGTAILI